MYTYLMQKTLFLKKTIGILAIILGALRFLSCIYSYSGIYALERTSTYYNDVNTFVNICKFVLPLETTVTVLILILGILLLCAEKGVPPIKPRPISRRIALSILFTSISYLLMEALIIASTPVTMQEPVTIFFSFGFVCTFIIICSLGLRPVLNDTDTPQKLSNINETSTGLDNEIAELKKKIEKLKLEQELHELNEKQEN